MSLPEQHFPKTSIFATLMFAVCSVLIVLGVWRFGYAAALDQLNRRGEAELALAANGLTNELEQFRELAVFLADHPYLQEGAAEDTDIQSVKQLLLESADKSGSLDIVLIDESGREVAKARELPSENHAQQPYLERAFDGALGTFHLFSERYNKRAFYFAAPIFAKQGRAIGAVMVIANVEAVEAAWRGDRPTLFFTDDLGVIFLSNRSELVFGKRAGNSALQSRTASYPEDLLSPFFQFKPSQISNTAIWSVDGGRYLPSKAVHIAMPLPVINMQGEVLIDVAPARQLAILQTLVAAGLCFTFGALLFFAAARRRRLAKTNLELENRVVKRTAALERLNNNLRAEVLTREAAEADLTRTQAELVQAGKLSALGQMSAGISHELNQPLMAIRSFAENGTAFIAQGKSDVASENLGRISELAQRMGRIIQNLRAFARHEEVEITDVDIVSVIDAVVALSEPKARHAGVTLKWEPPGQSIHVRGGDVRLQQILLNLVGNAIDAMTQSDTRLAEIELVDGDRVKVRVRDTGPGILEPEKIFDPFYTTKTVETGDGMGLGLSISYGLVQSFGGDIRGINHPDGGAVFTVELDHAKKDTA